MYMCGISRSEPCIVAHSADGMQFIVIAIRRECVGCDMTKQNGA
jgi:hypothetical protein